MCLHIFISKRRSGVKRSDIPVFKITTIEKSPGRKDRGLEVVLASFRQEIPGWKDSLRSRRLTFETVALKGFALSE